MQHPLLIYVFHQQTIWENLAAIEQVNGAFELMISGEFALIGKITKPKTLKLLIITRKGETNG